MAYGRETTAAEVLEGVDLSRKVAVVTGASSGLGREVSRVLASSGADVVAAVRDPSSAPAGSRVVELDLGSLDSIRSAAPKLLAEVGRVDMLFNNAGVMATPEATTEDGFELQLGVNHLGHFLFTALLAPAIAPDGRIVQTTSLGHMITGMLWDHPHLRTCRYDKWRAYGQSKTANILFARGLAERGFTAFAVHPGAIHTGLTRYLEGAELVAVEQASESEAKSVQQGAATLVWAATVCDAPSGSYLADCAIAEPAPHATDPADVERLWIWSEEQVGQTFAV
jgi:NAD(P)-dependent dehydrogenase (short-subunit alcohol dehydrogenase family)